MSSHTKPTSTDDQSSIINQAQCASTTWRKRPLFAAVVASFSSIGFAILIVARESLQTMIPNPAFETDGSSIVRMDGMGLISKHAPADRTSLMSRANPVSLKPGLTNQWSYHQIMMTSLLLPTKLCWLTKSRKSSPAKPSQPLQKWMTFLMNLGRILALNRRMFPLQHLQPSSTPTNRAPLPQARPRLSNSGERLASFGGRVVEHAFDVQNRRVDGDLGRETSSQAQSYAACKPELHFTMQPELCSQRHIERHTSHARERRQDGRQNRKQDTKHNRKRDRN